MSSTVTPGTANVTPGVRSLPIAVALLLPIALVNMLGFLLPVLDLLVMSVRTAEASGALSDAWTLASWSKLTHDVFYLQLLWNTVRMSLIITLLTLLASYPIALYLHRSHGTWRNFLLVLVIAPLLTSAVVRTYGWMVILGDGGVVAAFLRWLGMAKAPRMVFNTTGVVVGLVEILMPYMILALIAGFGRLNASLEEAASSLGARPWTVFRRIVVPLTLPGIMLGCLLAFVLAVSSFITPKLLGGGRVFLLATEIYDQAIVTLNWPVAAALSLVVLVIFGVALTLYGRLSRAIA